VSLVYYLYYIICISLLLVCVISDSNAEDGSQSEHLQPEDALDREGVTSGRRFGKIIVCVVCVLFVRCV